VDCRRSRCGTGQVTAALAPFVAGESRRRLGGDAAGRETRLHGFENVAAAPASSRPADRAGGRAATLMLVLHQCPSRSARSPKSLRFLNRGSLPSVVDMLPHDRETTAADWPCWVCGGACGSGSHTTTTFVLFTKQVRQIRSPSPPPGLARQGPGLFVANRQET